MATHRVTKVVSRLRDIYETPIRNDGSTKGKMKLYRTTVKAEVVEFMDVIGAGRFNTPIPSTRRI